ncbi:DUF429 domain-containing protein [Aestuariivirga litoralis]|uniref:DUF429 domain-containing protein n=1 Tax=Aestuariivirga litoralis TaxID=2650924 RepID=UPI0018C76542|nr:DUF429 domain-containing protein [Aestuariivirga litoralis]MBG1233679.1 DUF429 domain-containing protein [Aestuariivirga litoralis]
MSHVIGVDGARGGWIAAIWDGEALTTRLFAHFAEVLELDTSVIAVDMPIGLPPLHRRKAEREARAKLTGRKSSIFAIPSRAAIYQESYAAACVENLKHSDPPRKLSKQTFHLFPKMREVDGLMMPALQALVHETHPELAFCAMNVFAALRHSKKTPEGEAERMALLQAQGLPALQPHHFDFPRKDVKRDDVIDACAAAWSAWRILERKALRFPDVEERDALGLLMRIEV